MFLEKGPSAAPTDPKKSEELMGKHLGNFKRLFEQGDLLMAGPLADPEKVKRGIVALTLGTQEEVERAFLPDEFVQTGVFHVNSFKVRPYYGTLNLQAIDPSSIEENRLVVWTQYGDKPTAMTPVYGRHEDYVKQAGPRVKLAFAARTQGEGRIREVLLFQSKDAKAIDDFIAHDPYTLEKQQKATSYAQYLAKGTLDIKLGG